MAQHSSNAGSNRIRRQLVVVMVVSFLVICCCPIGVSCFSVASFFPKKQQNLATTSHSLLLHAALGDLAAPEPPPIDEALFKSARAKLPWEVLLEKQEGPVLNLSKSTDTLLSLSDEAQQTTADSTAAAKMDDATEEGNDKIAFWESGQLWATTRTRLVDLWVLPRDMSNGADENYAVAATKAELEFLKKVPQLLRLETVVETAEFILDLGLPPALLRSEPLLLSYAPHHVTGGFEFLSKMSMLQNNKTAVLKACKDTPGLLVGSIEGYIQEQTVKQALGDAAEATSKTNKKLASDMAQAYRAVKTNNGPQLGQ